ncbi:transposase [Actinopolymorpha pittospori]|uniref:transposase n=1 Tax=Actinopolymorpha pittospori TaxID=648752 RepID=UPI00192D47F3
MAELQDIRTGRHRVLATHVLVFVTKFPHKVFGNRHPSRIEQIIADVRAALDAELVQFNRENNHAHLRSQPPAQDGNGPAGQQPQRRPLPPPATGVPRPPTPPLPGQQTLIGFQPRGLRGRATP